MDKKKRNLGDIAKSVLPDVALVGLIVMIVVMLITPLSPAIIDVLVFFSLTLAIITLMITIYVEDSVAFSTYPVVLLILAVWRISLSVATTRNILVDGDAGKIITAFGEVAISGNLIVGIVIFFLITIVQFIVINKGSERVAEVGARFTLDSLPGKQMSIDADVRSGSIDASKAQHLRAHLQAESQFHGAMDGAMKFLKGDAIAGLLMVFINFIGGLAIGSIESGLSFNEVIQKYTILSIGDALIGQIPAIFTAVSAGILVTRVSTGPGDNDDEKPTLSGEVFGQFLGYSRAFAAAAFVIVVIALIPGFPTLLCMSFAAACGLTYWLIERNRARIHRGYESGRPGGNAPARIHLLIGPELGTALDIPEAEIALRSQMRSIAHEAGLPCPACEIHVDSAVSNNLFVLVIDDVPVAGGDVNPTMRYAVNCDTILKVCGITPAWRETDRPGVTYLFIKPEQAELVASFGVPVMDPLNYMIEKVASHLRLSVGRLIDVDHVRKQLMDLAKVSPEVYRELLKVLQPAALADLMRKLAVEQVPIRNPNKIFEKLLLVLQREKDPHAVLRGLRQSMSDSLSFKWLCSDGRLYTIQVDDETTERLSGSIRATPEGENLDIPLELAQSLAGGIAEALQAWQLEIGKLVLLVPAEIRGALWRLLELSFPGLPILAFEELRRDVEVQAFRVIGMVNARIGQMA